MESPETSTSTLSNNGSPQSASEACGINFLEPPLEGFNQPVNAACGSNFSNSDTDLGYESGNSPYSAHYSPQIVSPGQGNFGSGFGQGQLPVYSPNPSLASNQFNNDNSDVEQADKVLDTLLKNFTSEDSLNGDYNIAAIFSTIQNLTSQTETPVSTYVQSPGLSSKFTPTQASPSMASQKRTEQKSNSVLRNILTMPEKDLPNNLPSLGLGFSNISKTCSKQGSHSSNQVCSGSQNKLSAQKLESCDGQSGDNVWGGAGLGNEAGASTCPLPDNGDVDSLGLGIPDEISDFAMQYLNDVMDSQADSVIAQLQDDDTFMDTSDSDVLTKVLLNTLESHCTPSLAQTVGNDSYNSASGVLDGNISKGECYSPTSPMSTDSQYNCMSPINGGVFLSGQSAAASNSIAGGSSHDHVYHQSVNRANSQNRSRSQKIPDNGMSNCFRQNRNCRNNSCQTQTSEYCLSELERHLRNKREGQGHAAGESLLSTSPKPFLEQLLTGTLTKDMYMKMERERFGEHPGPK